MEIPVNDAGFTLVQIIHGLRQLKGPGEELQGGGQQVSDKNTGNNGWSFALLHTRTNDESIY
jgi:hypothetical protein